jgi:2-polyprenyl-6-methoxyphenol hydroxylase-like FAD-dependent oxidoreductase
VGAGPVGLVSALALAQNRIPVRIIDKLPEPAFGQRGAGIMVSEMVFMLRFRTQPCFLQPRTLEVYKFLGVLDKIKARGGWLQKIQAYDADGNPQTPRQLVQPRDPSPDIPEVS